MMGDLFIGHDMPEPPKEGFFKGLFGGGSRSLDREELCKRISKKKFFLIEKLIKSGINVYTDIDCSRGI